MIFAGLIWGDNYCLPTAACWGCRHRATAPAAISYNLRSQWSEDGIINQGRCSVTCKVSSSVLTLYNLYTHQQHVCQYGVFETCVSQSVDGRNSAGWNSWSIYKHRITWWWWEIELYHTDRPEWSSSRLPAWQGRKGTDLQHSNCIRK